MDKSIHIELSEGATLRLKDAETKLEAAPEITTDQTRQGSMAWKSAVPLIFARPYSLHDCHRLRKVRDGEAGTPLPGECFAMSTRSRRHGEAGGIREQVRRDTARRADREWVARAGARGEGPLWQQDRSQQRQPLVRHFRWSGGFRHRIGHGSQPGYVETFASPARAPWT